MILLLLTSCKGDAQNNKVEKEQINFFDKKYDTDNKYYMVIDESNISNHPIKSYLNCKKEGYFSIHFIPKTDSLRQFWENIFFKNYDFNNFNIERDNIYIRNKIKNNYDKYNIFSIHIEKKFLSSNNACSVESTYFIDNSYINIYLYNEKSQNWKLLKTIKAEMLPPYYDNKFFVTNFSKYFITTTENKNNSNKPPVSNSSLEKLKGSYKISSKAISNYNGEEILLDYFLSFESSKKAILSIGADHSEDYGCEGEYKLTKENNILHARGKCDQDDVDDFYIKSENEKYYIKSKRFINQDWQELEKNE
ncbi:hypothetical protein [Chryseobacterium sp. FH2]|uniref:hypothetical protein n=1 Tax=Chryseobacterium sp. FH2 TaxID=1674291 RepID=UPI000A8E3E7D|nr:hypothetical protein [Chryseobacterium sp. FH2]